MHKETPNGLKIEELREMILNKEITIDTLSPRIVQELLEHEIEWADIDHCDEPTILDELLEVVNRTNYFDSSLATVSEERYSELIDEAFCKAAETTRRPRRRISKKMLLVAAAIAILASLSISVYASCFGPFDSFVDNLRDLFGIRVGEIIETTSEELMADNTCDFYNDFESLLKAHPSDIVYPREYPTEGTDSINFHQAGTTICVTAQYPTGTLRIYLENPPFTENDLLNDTPQAKTYVVNGFTYYCVQVDEELQYMMFRKDTVYIILTDNHSDFKVLANHIKGDIK